MQASPPEETGPAASPPLLGQLLNICLLDPALLLPSNLRAALLAPFHLHGVPESNEPFYKHLAKALLTCSEKNAPSSRVYELVNSLKEVMRCPKMKLHVQEPFFSQLKAGSKTIEGRCAIGAFNSIMLGDTLLFNDVLIQEVKMVNHYISFDEMLRAEGLEHVLPGVMSFVEGLAIYRQFYSEEKELSGGVLAIHVENASEEKQPLAVVTAILEELVLYGVEALQSFVVSVVV